jgi:hypothetical protein
MVIVYYKGTLREIPESERKSIAKQLKTIDDFTQEEIQGSATKLKLGSYNIVDRPPTPAELSYIPDSLAASHHSLYPNFWTTDIIVQHQQLRSAKLGISSTSTGIRETRQEDRRPSLTVQTPVTEHPLQTPEEEFLEAPPIRYNPLITAPQATLPKPSGSRPPNMEVTLPMLVADAIRNISVVGLDVFDYQGFDPMKIRQIVLDKGSNTKTKPIKVKGVDINFFELHVGNDVAFMVTLGLMRGNGLKKIEQKSLPEMNAILKLMINAYGLQEKTDRSPIALTLMRIVNSFPEVAYAALVAGRGRDITGLGLTPLLANPVSFQMVQFENFKDYAMHFLLVSHHIDLVINKPPKKTTGLKELWNYMILSYKSPVIPNNKRLPGIGQVAPVLKGNFSFQNSPHWALIDQKIAANDASLL